MPNAALEDRLAETTAEVPPFLVWMFNSLEIGNGFRTLRAGYSFLRTENGGGGKGNGTEQRK
jgi:hypothetical protein